MVRWLQLAGHDLQAWETLRLSVLETPETQKPKGLVCEPSFLKERPKRTDLMNNLLSLLLLVLLAVLLTKTAGEKKNHLFIFISVLLFVFCP